MGVVHALKTHGMRVTHLTTCLAIMLPLLLVPSELHRIILKRENLIHGIFYLLFFATACITYFIASFTDPGYLTPEKARIFRRRRGQWSYRGGDSSLHSSSEWKPTSLQPQNDETGLSVPQARDSAPQVAFSKDSLSHAVDIENQAARDSDNTEASPVPWCCPLLFTPSYWFNPQSGVAHLHEDSVVTLSVPVRFCKRCSLEQPLRCRHCPDCGRCVIKFDHHCPWLGNCVGERNHSSFVVFLLCQVVLIWWTLYFSWTSIVSSYLWSDWFRNNGLFIFEIIILILLGIPVTGLLAFHSYLALASRTTWETVAYERINYLNNLEDKVNPFNQGCARNCYAFCCSRYPLGWDRIYADAVGQSAADTAVEPPASPNVHNTTAVVNSRNETSDAGDFPDRVTPYQPNSIISTEL